MPIVFKAGVQPPPQITTLVQILLYVLRYIAQAVLGRSTATITDWFRTPSQNLAVGGVANSKHLLGLAVDVRKDAAGALLANAWRAVGGVVVEESDHWHLQLPF